MSEYVYLDNASTTYLKKDILDEMMPFLTSLYGNPSSIHDLGQKSKKSIEIAKNKIASILNCEEKEIFFTSSGTESNNWALKGIAYANKTRGNHIITSQIEHSSILETCKYLEHTGFKVTYLPVNDYGLISIKDLESSITNETILISIMFANNEIGTIQPIQEISRIALNNNIYLHTDAIQVIGNMEIDVNKYNIDLLSLSGHKIYGPKGIGVLYVKNKTNIENFIHGGAQEGKMRPGTPNVANCVGLGFAMESIYNNLENRKEKLKNLRNVFLSQMFDYIDNIKVNGHPTRTLPNIVNLSLENVNAKQLVYTLNSNNIYISNGAACICKSKKPSHVMLAIGHSPEEAAQSVRISFSEENTIDHICYVSKIISDVVKDIRKS